MTEPAASTTAPTGLFDHPSPILIVEDDPSIQLLLVDLLAELGYPVVTAASGSAGIEAVRACHPSLVLLDYQLPICNADVVLDAIRDTDDEPTVVLTSVYPDAERVAVTHGVAGFLRKPFDLDDVVAVIARHVSPAASA